MNLEGFEKQELDRLVAKFTAIKRHLESNEKDPLLEETYEEYLSLIQEKYGRYLDDVLFDIHDEYCEDFEVKDIEAYVSLEGVEVYAEDFPGVKAKLFLKANPLRCVMASLDRPYEEEIWRAA